MDAQPSINVALVGVGNCASSLIQGIEYYTNGNREGLLHKIIGKYQVSDIKIVLGFDIDQRKVGKDISEAIWSSPNVATKFCEVPHLNAPVLMGKTLDGVSAHMKDIEPDMAFSISEEETSDIVNELKKRKVDILINYLPVGSDNATKLYAKAALSAGCAFINCIPTFVASDNDWSDDFKNAGLPVLGDDIKSQLGATWIHRSLVQAFLDKGIKISRTSQENYGGNTDFLNMMDDNRIKSKLKSKRSSIEHLVKDHRYGKYEIPPVYAGPGRENRKHGFVKDKGDNKEAIIAVEGVGFGGQSIKLKANLNVEDSPNSAGIVIDAIRCAKLALDQGFCGSLDSVSPFLFKHPKLKVEDAVAINNFEEFIGGRNDK